MAEAVDAVRGAGDPPIALFHCVSSYPASPADANLRAIAMLRAHSALPGWSDHTLGRVAARRGGAGRLMVEKYLALDRTMPGPDHRASLEPADFAAMTEAIRTGASRAMGSGAKEPVLAEVGAAAVARRSLHWTRTSPPGRIAEVTWTVRCARRAGLPSMLREVVGRETVRLRAGTAAVADDLEPAP
ncbi:MAG: N-acetylneuraminate synthase family protein [Chloroflexota bacterium]